MCGSEYPGRVTRIFVYRSEYSGGDPNILIQSSQGLFSFRQPAIGARPANILLQYTDQDNISGQWSVVGPSTVSGSVVGGWRSVVGEWSVVGGRPSTVSGSVVGEWSVVVVSG